MELVIRRSRGGAEGPATHFAAIPTSLPLFQLHEGMAHDISSAELAAEGAIRIGAVLIIRLACVSFVGPRRFMYYRRGP